MLISFEKALELVCTAAKPLCDSEEVTLEQVTGRILAADVFSDIEMPPFNKAAMDGYACRYEDIHQPLRIVERIQAGKLPQKQLHPGECAKIMTGAAMPEGAECVLMVEDCSVDDSNLVHYSKETTKPNYCIKGDDLKEGQCVVQKDVCVQPQHIAVLAAAGAFRLNVWREPHICILVTGDELVEPYEHPLGGQIRNANGWQALSQIAALGDFPVTYCGIVGDNHTSTLSALKEALDKAPDVILITGGVSMGDFDFVPSVMNECEIDIHFSGIAVKPGKPTTFGTKGSIAVFGMPGNPISSFVQFKVLVEPYLAILRHQKPPRLTNLPMGKSWTRRESERMNWFPIHLSDKGEVIPVDYHGSADIFAYTQAVGVAACPAGVYTLNIGDHVDVRLF